MHMYVDMHMHVYAYVCGYAHACVYIPNYNLLSLGNAACLCFQS